MIGKHLLEYSSKSQWSILSLFKAGDPFMQLCLRLPCVSKSIQYCSSLGYPFYVFALRLRCKCITGAAKLRLNQFANANVQKEPNLKAEYGRIFA